MEIVNSGRHVKMPDAAVVDETIRRSVLALLEGHGFSKDDLAFALNIHRGTLFSKLAAKAPRPSFTAGELARMAAFFDVPVSDLFDGLGGRLVPRLVSRDTPG